MSKNRYKILLVDDELNFLKSLKDIFELEGYKIFTVANGFEALQLLEKQTVDVVITDIRMPKMTGMALLEQIVQRWPHILVFMLTGYGSIENAVQSVKTGAENYILKPVDAHDLIENVRKSLAKKVSGNLPNNHNTESLATQIIGDSEPVRKVKTLIQKIAVSDLSVLITGESGTGKELAAEAIFRNSNRKKSPFLKINCAALPEHLLESELFGYEQGAFTDAKNLRKGKLEIVNKGTLFLDEIGDMPFTMQAKLLRVLEEKKLERLGGNKTIAVDFRLISATNQNLQHLIAEKKFREDLFFRLNMVQIHLPALREIPEDIPKLCRYFLECYSRDLKIDTPAIHSFAMEKLKTYNWPGNIRELKNSIHRAIVLSGGQPITNEHLPPGVAGTDVIENPEQSSISSMDEMERDHIRRILKITGGNKNRAASILQIHRDTLYRKLKKYRIESPPESG